MDKFNRFKSVCIYANLRLGDKHSGRYWDADDEDFNLEAEAALCPGMEIVLVPSHMLSWTECHSHVPLDSLIPMDISDFSKKFKRAWHFFGRNLLTQLTVRNDHLFVVDEDRMNFAKKMWEYQNELKAKVQFPDN